jgi:SAM-dependent methyltransferase
MTWPSGGGIDPKAFWEDKLVGWEEGRYTLKPGRGLLERIADRASDSLRFRLQSAGELLAPVVRDRHVVDVGCGTGLLAEALLNAGCASYTGLDIAEGPIAQARERAAARGWTRARFEVATVGTLPDIPRDVIVSLGLTDWLTDAELSTLLTWGGQADFLHAISEDRGSVPQRIHQAYCWIAYGWRTRGYVPRYFNPAWFAGLATNHPGPFRVWRHPRLSFGAYITTLPIGDPL